MASKKPDFDEVELAFSKLQANAYFDNYDLNLREKIAKFKNGGLTNGISSFLSEFDRPNPFSEKLKSSVKIVCLPKKMSSRHIPVLNNFYNNKRVGQVEEIEKPFLFCDLGIELHLIASIWIIRYGAYLDATLTENAFGNRLILNSDKNEVIGGRAIFKPYFKEFQNWWSLAVKKAKQTLAENKSVAIINFDIQSFYHNIRFDFDLIESKLATKYLSIKRDPIHKLLKEIHNEYKSILLEVRNDTEISQEGQYPLPIGLLTSHLFANYYLKRMDYRIEKKINPLYYGRYVDDILIVIEDESDFLEEDSSENKKLFNEYLSRQLPSLFEFGETISLSQYPNLKVNQEKLFIYRFDPEFTPNLIDSFVEEQKEKASIFKFLSDEEDEYFEDFDTQTFESNFEHVDANKARFKNIEDNKYKLSVFFSKLIKRRIQKDSGYRDADLKKIIRYFKGSYLLKNYFFWEKLLTLCVVYDEPILLNNLIIEISTEIKELTVKKDSRSEFSIKKELYVSGLKRHFRNSLKLAVGLNLNILRNNDLLKTLKEAKLISSIDIEEAINRFSLFKNTGLLRGAFIYYPLLQFTNFSYNMTLNLTDKNSLNEAFLRKKKGTELESRKYDLVFAKNIRTRSIPFRVKFWQVALMRYYNNLLQIGKKISNYKVEEFLPETEEETKGYWFSDSLHTAKVLNDAFDDYFYINSPSTEKETLKTEFFSQVSDPQDKGEIKDSPIRIPAERSRNYFAQEFLFKNGGETKDLFRVCIVNKYVSLVDMENSLIGNPILGEAKVEIFKQIWDQVGKIDQCDLFIMPELCLPHGLISSYVEQSARKQIAFISGVEHLNVFNVGFNFILTTLPVNLAGDKDAIPILRLKNHYAPEEEDELKLKGIIVPKPNPYRYDLFIWRGVYFSSYYCYELADVFHRSIFFSKIDILFAPVWNIDTHYYNSIIDTATRDMHNYFVIVNTAQYGFSKISRPRDFVNKEKIIIKGGTQGDYQFTLAVGDLKIKKLRDFQLLSYSDQKEANKKKKSFKPTPPDFPRENVIKRINNRSFNER